MNLPIFYLFLVPIICLQYEPLFDSDESVQFVNQIVLYECQGNSVRLASMVREGGRDCLNMPAVPCNSIVASWSRGSSVSKDNIVY